ncbi:MAG: ribokinase [Rudaea sp.]
MMHVAVVGSFNVDHVWRVATLPQAGATLSGDYASGPGGKGFNQAMAARRAGAITAFVCALGDDAGAQLARALCAGDGIDLREHACDAPTGTAGIYVDAQGRNEIVVAAGANVRLEPGFVESTLAALPKPAVVLAQLESPADAIESALRFGRGCGAVTVLNPAPANAVVSEAMLQLADVLTPNETEFAAMLARAAHKRMDASTLAQRDDANLHALTRELRAGTVVVTLGAQGCFVSHGANQRGDDAAYYRVPAAPAKTIDTTGAGDAFNGALAASLPQHPQLPFAEHVRFATRYAALSTEREGAALAMPKYEMAMTRFGPR